MGQIQETIGLNKIYNKQKQKTMKTLLLSLLCVLLFGSCSKEPPPAYDPDMEQIALKPGRTEVIPHWVEYTIFNTCTNEYVVISGLATYTSTITQNGDILKHVYSLSYNDVNGVGLTSGNTYSTYYEFKGTIVVDLSNGQYVIKKDKQNLKIVYSCSNGQNFTNTLDVKFIVDKHGGVKVDRMDYNFEICN